LVQSTFFLWEYIFLFLLFGLMEFWTTDNYNKAKIKPNWKSLWWVRTQTVSDSA
jgi:quinol-cytochrome oxidoreductase complex cytochrome b subunit